MKKLFTIIAIAALTISSAFPTTNLDNINVDGFVKNIPYSFDISYDNRLIDTDYISDGFKLSESSRTKDFVISKSKGNTNNDFILTIIIKTFPFIGKYKTNENFNTEIVPKIHLINGYEYTYSDIVSNKTQATLKVNIKAGSHLDPENISGFYLINAGSASVPAGVFTSKISISFTYDQ